MARFFHFAAFPFRAFFDRGYGCHAKNFQALQDSFHQRVFNWCMNDHRRRAGETLIYDPVPNEPSSFWDKLQWVTPRQGGTKTSALPPPPAERSLREATLSLSAAAAKGCRRLILYSCLQPFDPAERDLNATLKPQLRSIHASLELDSEVTATIVTILKTLLDDIFVQMKQTDPLFHQLFKRLECTGSYSDGLRIKKADEFDINLVLNLPFEKDEFTVSDGCPGHVGYEVGPAAVGRLLREGDAKWVPLLLKWMDGERRLVPYMVTWWLQSVLDRVLRTYVVPSRPCSAVETIRLMQHGPAVTLHIQLRDGNQIDVDLVPVIEFRHPSWPTGVQKKGWMANMLPEDCNWFLIPKPPVPKSHLWRLHFPNMEKRLIEDHGSVKPIIRLLKAMRDSYGWNLSSYSLKTFVMSQVVANDDAQYWHPDNQGMLFVRVLDCLGQMLAQPGPAISFLFHPEVDLTETVTRKTRDSISGQIKRIVRKLWLSPDQCYELVLKNQRKGRAS